MSTANASHAYTVDARATLRLPTKLAARMRDRSGTRCSVRVTNLSLAGFRAETVAALRPGTLVWLMLAGIEGLEAKIVWQRGECVGAAFVRPLHAAVFDHIVRLAA